MQEINSTDNLDAPIEELELPASNDEAVTPSQKAPPPRKKRVDLSALSFVRLIDPIHIPKYLITQIKDRLFDVDKFYEHQKMMCLIQTPNGFSINPYNFLYALVNKQTMQTKGMLWCVVDPLTDTLVINNFSIDGSYWNKGEALQLLEKQVKTIQRDLGLKRIVWITKNTKFCKAKGFKESKFGLMMYEE